MEDYTNKNVQIGRVLFMSGLEKENISAQINNNFLIINGKEENTQTWFNLNSIFKMENVKVISE